MTAAVAEWGVRVRGVDAIERELARMRRERTQRARASGGSGARTSVLTLIVYATRPVHARRAAGAIAELSRRHPARAVIVLVDRVAPSASEGALTTHCDVPNPAAGHEICYEQVLIHARGEVEERVTSAVAPLVIPDLPVFLWWTGTPPLDAGHFAALAAAAGRIIVDSADFARPGETLPRIAVLCARGKGRYGVTDLSWTRLTPWRELVTQFFDVPRWRPFLDALVEVHVGYAVDADGRQSHPSQALLLYGWLASRLGWTGAGPIASSEAGGHTFSARGADGPSIPVRLRPRYDGHLGVGDLTGLRLRAALDGVGAQFVIERTDATHAQVTADIGGAVSARTVLLPPPSVVELLGEELTIMASDPAYEAALGAVVALG